MGVAKSADKTLRHVRSSKLGLTSCEMIIKSKVARKSVEIHFGQPSCEHLKKEVKSL